MKNQESFKIIFPLALAILTAPACSSTRQVDPIPEAEAASLNHNSADAESSYSTEVSFEKNSAKLDQSDRQALDDLVKKSLKTGDVQEIKVVSWADLSYPKDANADLPNQQKKLAEKRSEQIKSYIKSTYPNMDVEVYSMAKRPNAFQQLYQSADARTKQSFENAGLTMNEADMNPPAKTSRAVVLSILKK